MQDGNLHDGVESRAAARTNLFVAATLISHDVSEAVKIRDLSETGARIETSQDLEVGAAVTLVRGALSVHARVGWYSMRFCGLSFASPVSIADWMANPVNLDREEKPPWVDLELHRAAGKSETPAQELARVSRWLEAFAHTLSNDPQVVFKHGTQLFSLGLAARALGALAESMPAELSRSAAKTTP